MMHSTTSAITRHVAGRRVAAAAGAARHVATLSGGIRLRPAAASSLAASLLAAKHITARTSLATSSTNMFPSLSLRGASLHTSALRLGVEATKVPSLGDSISEGTIVKFEKAVGEWVEADDVIVVIETDKVSVDIRSPKAGVVKAHLVAAGDTVKVGQDIVQIDTDAKKPEGAAKPAAPAAAPAAPKKEAAPTAAPAAAPAKAAPAAAPAAAEKKAAPAPAATVAPPAPGSRNERKVPLTRMRQTIANRLKLAQNTAACLTTFNEIDMTNIMALRNKYKDEFLEKHGVKLGFMSVFVKAATQALLKNPDVNAYMQDGNLIYHDFVDVSVAVSTGSGLVVPVLRNTEGMSFAQVEAAIAAYGAKARKGQIAMEDMVGGTFTISNGGVFGSLMGTPILNPPQSAILGMHGIFERPVAINGKMEIRPMMYVALTYDHRVIDGSGAVTFLRDVKAAVEDPARMVLGL